MKRVHVFVSGKVQGVNFRWNTMVKAKELGIKGWVRNLMDGRVEVVAEGEEDKIEEFVKFLRQGPPRSQVTKIEVKEEKFKNEFREFSIVY